MSAVAAQPRRNGVNTARLFETVDALNAEPRRPDSGSAWKPLDLGHAQPESDQHVLRRGRGAAAQSTFAIEADHPAVLAGGDVAPTRPRSCWRRWRRA